MLGEETALGMACGGLFLSLYQVPTRARGSERRLHEVRRWSIVHAVLGSYAGTEDRAVGSCVWQTFTPYWSEERRHEIIQQ